MSEEKDGTFIRMVLVGATIHRRKGLKYWGGRRKGVDR